MMKKYFFGVILLAIVFSIYSQAPQGFNYQAILRNSDGSIRSNETVSLQISIANNIGMSQYLEVHNTQTNELGLVSVVIGEGTSTDDLSSVEWAYGPYFLDVVVNGTSLGSNPILSVPYSLYAESGNEGPQGPKGDQGEIGPQGAQGPQGEPGVSEWDNVSGGISFNDGYVGIGNSTPGTFLDVSDSRNLIGFATNTRMVTLDRYYGNSHARLDIHGYPNTNDLPDYLRSSIMLYATGDAKNLKICAAPVGGSIQFLTDGWINESSERMRITADGNVGIGTTSPTTKLEVVGGVKIGSNGIRFSEINELAGTTASSGGSTNIDLASGWTSLNTRVLNIEVLHKTGNYWIGIGVASKEISYVLYSDHITLYHNPSNSDLNSTSYRVLMMKLE